MVILFHNLPVDAIYSQKFTCESYTPFGHSYLSLESGLRSNQPPNTLQAHKLWQTNRRSS